MKTILSFFQKSFQSALTLLLVVGSVFLVTAQEDNEIVQDSTKTTYSFSELSLPKGTIIALVARGEETLIPKGSITLQEDDQVFIVTKLLDKNAVEACFYPEK